MKTFPLCKNDSFLRRLSAELEFDFTRQRASPSRKDCRGVARPCFHCLKRGESRQGQGQEMTCSLSPSTLPGLEPGSSELDFSVFFHSARLAAGHTNPTHCHGAINILVVPNSQGSADLCHLDSCLSKWVPRPAALPSRGCWLDMPSPSPSAQTCWIRICILTRFTRCAHLSLRCPRPPTATSQPHAKLELT